MSQHNYTAIVKDLTRFTGSNTVNLEVEMGWDKQRNEYYLNIKFSDTGKTLYKSTDERRENRMFDNLLVACGNHGIILPGKMISAIVTDRFANVTNKPRWWN